MGKGVLALLALASIAHADATEDERDRLIASIASGVDYDASVKRFGVLVREQDAVRATSAAAIATQARAGELAAEYRKTADYEAGYRCAFSPKPGKVEGSSRPPTDWGRVTRKGQVTVAPKNALDEPKVVPIWEIGGRSGKHVIAGADHMSLDRKMFTAEVGDLVLLCADEHGDATLPPDWGAQSATSGLAVVLKRPPPVVDKAQLDAIPATTTELYWVIRQAKWKWRAGTCS